MAVKIEKCAATVVFAKSPDGSWDCLVLNTGVGMELPRGHLEKDEDDLAAAKRELEQEAGLGTDAVCFLEGFSHPFRYRRRGRDGDLIDKHVVAFVAIARSRRVTTSDEHPGGGGFVPYEVALTCLKQNERQAVRSACEWLRSPAAQLQLSGIDGATP